jgi:hypothetical protein
VTPVFHISRTVSALSLGFALLNLTAAALVLVAGILLLRDSRRAISLHRYYVACKIPIALCAAVVQWFYMTQMMHSIAIATPGLSGQLDLMMMISSAMSAAIALAYPIALLFVLRTRIIKSYEQMLNVGGR